MLEANPRASRTVPFVAKATGLPLVDLACRLMLGEPLGALDVPDRAPPAGPGPRRPSSPPTASPTPMSAGPEMRSTGEVMASGSAASEAYARALRAAGRSRRAGPVGPPLQHVG